MIQILPEHIIDQIKAGEVIERPANVLKELIENSIDANSSSIDIQLIDNGLTLISIEDNGSGISYDDLPYAFTRHATSKISKFEDLYNLNTYGFRGEALPSIASISKITCTSKGMIEFEGGKLISHVKLDENANGTSTFVRDLFFNTPARLKFLKSKSSENNSIAKTLNSLFIANNNITFSLKIDDKEKQIYPATTLENRVKNVLNKRELLHVTKEYENNLISIFYDKKTTPKHHYIFANGRYIQDRSIHSLLSQNEISNYVIFIKVPEHLIDVNVHPNKTQVKFFDHSVILSLIINSVREQKSYNRQLNTAPKQELKPYIQKTNEEFKKEFLHLFKKSFLISKDSILFLIDLNIALEKILNPTDLNFSHPLLISLPYKVSKTFDIKKLNDLGIEADFLDSETIVIRAIPDSIKDLPYAKIINSLICDKNLNLNTSDFSIDELQKIIGLIDLEEIGKTINEDSFR